MQVYIVIKNKSIYNPYDDSSKESIAVTDIDCVKATKDGALQRISELAKNGYRNADFIIKYLT